MGKKARPLKKTNSFLTGGLVTCLLAFSTGGCGEAQAVSSSDTKLQSYSWINKRTFYFYNPAGKPDPFLPFVETDLLKKKRTERLRPLPLSPLQRISLGEFRLVGIANDDKRKIAIVEDAKGRFYPLFHGTYIGPNNGMVVKILADCVIVEEKVKTGTGKNTKTKVKEIKIRLQKEGDEVRP
jgi:type IV pilus assembly protein PilP